jgi:hypothetical protein
LKGTAPRIIASVQPSPALPAPGASFSVSEYEARQTAKAAKAAGVTVAEYEARQKANGPLRLPEVAEYTRRQTRRR